MAQARPNPSYVEVPRPSSSMITSESFVAVCDTIQEVNRLLAMQIPNGENSEAAHTLRIAAVSSISAMNVETPFS